MSSPSSKWVERERERTLVLPACQVDTDAMKGNLGNQSWNIQKRML